MTYIFDEVTPCEVGSIAKTHPYKVLYTTPDGQDRRRYFQSVQDAREWREWALQIVAVELPKGVTIDLRQAKPYYARKTKFGKRIGFYASTVQEAVKWLATR